MRRSRPSARRERSEYLKGDRGHDMEDVVDIDQEKTWWEAGESLRREVAGGLLYAHHRANANTSRTLEVTAFAYALIDLLIEKGLLTEAELNERKRQVGQLLVKKFNQAGMYVEIQAPAIDKYVFEDGPKIDCENRVHLGK